MNWIQLSDEKQLAEISERSKERPQVIFKHSTRCSISSVAKNRLDKADAPKSADFYYLDLINNRTISNFIAEQYQVTHESPQVLIIRNGECVYDESHMGISMQQIEAQVI